MEPSFGVLCFLPVIVVIAVGLMTKRTLLSLICGILTGWIIVSKAGFIWSAVDDLITTAADPGNMWMIVVCGLFGSVTLLLQKSGGARAFGDWLGSKAKGEKSSLILTWILGLLIFVDDYLNCLVIGSTMKKVTDKYKVSREYLSYLVDSTAGPICILLPFSTWAVYSAGLIESNGLTEKGGGIEMYIQSIPFALYPIIAGVIIVPLVILGIVPKFKPLQDSCNRAKETGQLAPAGSENMSMKEIDEAEQGSGNLWNFIIPIVVLIGVTMYYGIDLLYGTVAAVVVAFLMALVQKLMTVAEASKAIFEGFQSMLMPLCIIIAAFMLKNVNDQLGLTDYVINLAMPYMNGALLPAITFFIVAALGFFTGANWGTWAITLPIVIPLAAAADVNMLLLLGAVWSGGGFGTHMCPWGDATVLSSAASGCDNFAHVKTQLPLALTSAIVAFILYIVLGYIMA